VDHTDSLGAAGRFGKGDVQWMTAGKGVQHSEMFPLVHEDKQNPLEIFQIWLNLPRASKLVEPHFKMLWNEDIPVVEEKNDSGHSTFVNVIAGKLAGVAALTPTPNSWAANPENDIQVWTIRMEANADFTIPKGAKESSRTLFFYRGGNIDIEGQPMVSQQLANLKSDEEINIRNGETEAFFLLLQGKPINEPVVQYGPFVMNTQAEIQEAFAEYRATQYGGWPWPEAEQTHPREKGRFALHADGREEVPG
jgi:redox-sensitive bicupin YhaK (pirin superfamily)